MRLILVRHGQSPSNVLHLLDTAEPGPGLTDLGAHQAVVLASALARERIGAVYASSLLRAQQTAAPVAAALGLDVRVRAGIREVAAGELEMRGDVASVERYLKTVFAWPAGDLDRRMPGGENGHEVLARFDAVVAEACAPDDDDDANDGADRTALLVSHGGAIRVWTSSRAENLDAAFGATHTLPNTGTVILEGAPTAGWRAVSWTGADLDAPARDSRDGLEPGFA